MSRVGKNPVPIPAGVTVDVAGQMVKAKGKKGELSLRVAEEIAVAKEGNAVTVKMREDTKRSRVLWGTSRALIRNLVQGAHEGYTVNLEIEGVGYRAAADAKALKLQLGFSHEVLYPIPTGIAIKTPKPTEIEISGADRQRVGQVAAEIRGMKPPEPYKGKGIKYAGEHILRKEGKKK
ncbi:50S ribosomal protein L6 [Reyranella sp. CPCC 100927]|uniref:50S ribosomal protein L6 n=1 Tax=Reyranella sp. CPCC 100927 TaxID=2599616 RepID=UPI0011B7BD58|nr:50S ribosomal protein L6 [Reyranella sp. CPCC 100927]TWT05720.1 50S ribosomal protein L6 [Reyranella sp. CPCC 100927]